MAKRRPRRKKPKPTDAPAAFSLGKTAPSGSADTVVGAIVAGPLGGLVGGMLENIFGAVVAHPPSPTPADKAPHETTHPPVGHSSHADVAKKNEATASAAKKKRARADRRPHGNPP